MALIELLPKCSAPWPTLFLTSISLVLVLILSLSLPANSLICCLLCNCRCLIFACLYDRPGGFDLDADGPLSARSRVMGREEKCNLSSISAHQKRAGNTFSALLSHTSSGLEYLRIWVAGYLGIRVSLYLCIFVSLYLCIFVSLYLCIWASPGCSDFGSNRTERDKVCNLLEGCPCPVMMMDHPSGTA